MTSTTVSAPPSAPSPYRLVRTPPARAAAPALDPSQRAVADHGDGPLLVLAGPGTGKTTTLVETVAERVRRGTDPERILVLTFSRKAAVELRDRMALRLGDAAGPQATTFHSFCYALVRAHQDPELFTHPLRLLSGPEQDVVVREMLAGEVELERKGLGGVRWPDELRACLTTRGFADEVRAVLARSRELGLGPDALAAFARRTGRPDWAAAADFLAEYLDVLDAQGVLDYAELVHRAVLLAEEDGVADELRARYDLVLVDEYQDTDPAQVRLLHALAGGGRTLVAFGDPDQSIYAFRGADVNGILQFRTDFPRADGTPADVRVLRVSRRSGPRLLAATREIARRMPLTRLPAQAVRAHREPHPAPLPDGARDTSRVEVLTYPTPGAELDGIADLLRRAHLEDGVPWSGMAVLVRAGARSIPGVRRALTAAGVPLEIDGDDLPLRHEPAVAPLLLALRLAAEAAAPAPAGLLPGARPAGDAGDARPGEQEQEGTGQEKTGQEKTEQEETEQEETEQEGTGQGAATAPRRGRISAEDALTLLTSPLGGMDAGDLRRLGRALREEERAAGATAVPPSDELIAQALSEPERLVVHEDAYARPARRLGLLLRSARDLLAGGGSAEEALWHLWDGTPWPTRLERASRRGGAAGRNADRDLDAVCALFETAARAEERNGGRGALNFLEELARQDIAADVIGRRTVRPDAVRLMTAHRSKGLEWRVVVVAGVQEGLWPDLRRRGSLLEADRIGRDGLAEPLGQGALLAEERRLFYVAATRAKERLVVTAVRAAAEDGDQPSRFLTELGVEPVDVTSRPRRPLAVSALVAELRATTVDPAASPALRDAAARRLARLAALRDDDGHPLVPSAHPDRWWGLNEPTHAKDPVRPPGLPVALSGSALEQLANTCALQWFLGREVRADTPSTAAQGFGNVVHVLADEVASGRAPADLDVLMERLDSVWDALAFDAPWKSAQERGQARDALERFLRWHVMERGRTPVATEHEFDVTLGAGDVEVRVRGSMDRVEEDAEGRAYVVDFKTGKARPTKGEVARHPQLAVYQLAVRSGAVDDVFGGRRPEPGGAELVQLRQPATGRDGQAGLPVVQSQEPPADGWAEELLATAAGRVLGENFTPATGNHCTRCSFHRVCSARPEGRHTVD
ncbi:ATP-dependent helicase [Streptomyces sp. NPDC059637]|uniref:ATP-dependent helicase n=1 Tax=Streptomyces sp. NPDC059637 TaxID=3347752 RepID=UPI0036D1A1C5